MDKWLDWLNDLETGDVDQMKDRILRSTALRGLDVAQSYTPRRSSRLVQSLTIGDKDNLLEVKIGENSYVFFGTAVEYAAPINDGFQQKKGRFVPGYWQNGTFHYQKGSKTGMVLSGKFVEGAHMFERAVDDLEQGSLAKIAEFEFRRLYAELFKGG